MHFFTLMRKTDKVELMRNVSIMLIACSLLVGCSSFVSNQGAKLAENLTLAIQNSDDLETVRTGAPAYMIMIDGLINGDSDNTQLLRSGANLYSAYTSVFAEDPERRRRLTARAMNYATRAACRDSKQLCQPGTQPFDTFAAAVAAQPTTAAPTLFTLGSVWAGWIEARSEDWSAVAELPRVKLVLQRVIELDERYRDGTAHLYLGVLSSLLPETLGGKPEEARSHFERAIEISTEKNLMAMVIYADRYARLVFDQALHDSLLRQVLTADPVSPGYTLMNTVAQQQARELLASSNDYF